MTGTERKVFQKYYPPDYDPSKIPRAKVERNRQFVQRVMSPFNMACKTCGEYIYKGKKFNMRRETAEGEFYLGLRIFRFYMRCPNCLAEITFKTDLENTDYKAEHGCIRLFEAEKVLREQRKAEEAKAEEEALDPMKMLEKRTKMSRTEMEALGTLEELREQNRREGRVDYDTMVLMAQAEELKRQEREQEAEEAFIDSVFGKKVKTESTNPEEPGTSGHSGQWSGGGGGKSGGGGGGSGGGSGDRRILIKRLHDSDEDDEDDVPKSSALAAAPDGSTKKFSDFETTKFMSSGSNKAEEKRLKTEPAAVKISTASQKSRLAGLVIVKKKGNSKPDNHPTSSSNSSSKPAGGLSSLIGDYPSSSSDEDAS